jgi:hypothetical protein
VASSALGVEPLVLASGGEKFPAVYARGKLYQLRMDLERPVVSQLLLAPPNCLFVFSNDSQDRWLFLNVKRDGEREKRRLYHRILAWATYSEAGAPNDRKYTPPRFALYGKVR